MWKMPSAMLDFLSLCMAGSGSPGMQAQRSLPCPTWRRCQESNLQTCGIQSTKSHVPSLIYSVLYRILPLQLPGLIWYTPSFSVSFHGNTWIPWKLSWVLTSTILVMEDKCPLTEDWLLFANVGHWPSVFSCPFSWLAWVCAAPSIFEPKPKSTTMIGVVAKLGDMEFEQL